MMHRRSLIAAAVAVPVAGFAGSFAQAAPVDPHPVWLVQWRAADAEWEKTEDGTPEYQSAWDAREALGKKICNTLAQTTAGALAQLQWFKDDYSHLFEGMITDEFAGILDTITATLEAVA